MRQVIDQYKPENVLEIGCGWGRVLDALNPYCNLDRRSQLITRNEHALAFDGTKAFTKACARRPTSLHGLWLQLRWPLFFVTTGILYNQRRPQVAGKENLGWAMSGARCSV